MNEYPESLQLVKNTSLHFGYTNFVEDHEYGIVYVRADVIPRPDLIAPVCCALLSFAFTLESIVDKEYLWAGFMALGFIGWVWQSYDIYKADRRLRNLVYADPS